MNVRNPDITGPLPPPQDRRRIRVQHEHIKNKTTHPALTGECGQKKIQPETIISDLKRRSEAIRRERVENEQYAIPDPYSDFNGLAEPGSEFDFYKRDKNWSNRMVLGDSLLVMTSLAEKEALKGQVQCIYMDPRYGIKFNSNWQPSTKSRKVKEGQEGLTRDPEMIRAFRDTWKDGVHSYLSYLRDRVAAAHMLLASEGSIFLQIGEENLHLVRSVLQEIFLPENFVVTFAIQKAGSVSGDFVQSNLNYILWFAKNTEAAKDKFHALFKYRSSSGFERSSENSLDRTDFEAYPLTSEGNRETTTVPFKFQGKSYHPGEDRHWVCYLPVWRGLPKRGAFCRRRTR
jgi:adenine-specific DNA-methyltransferase